MKQLYQLPGAVVLFALAVQAAAQLLRPLLPSLLVLLGLGVIIRLLLTRRL